MPHMLHGEKVMWTLEPEGLPATVDSSMKLAWDAYLRDGIDGLSKTDINIRYRSSAPVTYIPDVPPRLRKTLVCLLLTSTWEPEKFIYHSGLVLEQVDTGGVLEKSVYRRVGYFEEQHFIGKDAYRALTSLPSNSMEDLDKVVRDLSSITESKMFDEEFFGAKVDIEIV